MNIVLVHGIMNNGSVFFKMKNAFENEGHKCFTPSLKPSDGRSGLIDLGSKLKIYIEKNIQSDEQFVLIGFSMGGLISRYYLQELDGHKRVSKFFVISAPHKGTYAAYLYFGKGVKQMRPNSQFLKQLSESESIISNLETFSFYTPFDLSVFPYKKSIWESATNIKSYSFMHWYMIFNKNVINSIITKI